MDSIEGRSLPAGEYYLLQSIANGDSRMPVTEPKLTQMERLLSANLIRRESGFLVMTAEGHDYLRGSFYSAETGCFHKRIRDIGRIPR
jgi:hypothetical protein